MNTIEKLKLNYSKYIGEWKNSYDTGRDIGGFSFSESDGKLMISIEGAQSGILPGFWAECEVKTHAYAPGMEQVVAFQAEFETAEFKAHLAMNENQGLLIIAAYYSFPEGDPRSDYFAREFFYKT
ncbi:MAG: hypothetical protein JKY54_11735 [Flavobacteriales bacterium]|nr:hypothetical protein [Flavobacteriales bacterium]